MLAEIGFYNKPRWDIFSVDTKEPSEIRDSEGVSMTQEWIDVLPKVPGENGPLSIEEAPDTWVEKMSRMNYSRFGVRVLSK